MECCEKHPEISLLLLSAPLRLRVRGIPSPSLTRRHEDTKNFRRNSKMARQPAPGTMAKLLVDEMKVFLPAKDYLLSKAFYSELGFDLAWEAPERTMAKFAIGSQMFMLHDWYEKSVAEAIYMHLLVPDVEQWWSHIVNQRLSERYPIRTESPEDREWGIRDFVLIDPSGVLWRIGTEIASD